MTDTVRFLDEEEENIMALLFHSYDEEYKQLNIELFYKHLVRGFEAYGKYEAANMCLRQLNEQIQVHG